MSQNPPAALDVERIRRDFPILRREVHGKPLVWLDNAATTQKPQAVIERMVHYYQHENSNIHRGTHTLATEASNAYEGARARVAAFLGAQSAQEIVFVRGTTEGLNLLAYTLGASLSPGDEILISAAEHHANIVPWQFVAQQRGATIRVAPVDDRGDLLLEEYERLLGPRTRIAAFIHISNALGSVLPVCKMTRLAKQHGSTVIIDGAQGVPHRRVDMQAIGCDFYVFSGHKLFAPTGIGAVYGRKEMWEQLPPWQGGGMIEHVSYERSTFAAPPHRFEAGTPSIAAAIGLGAAIAYLEDIGMDAIERYESALLAYALAGLQGIKGLRLIGTPRERGGVISLVMEGIDDLQVARALDAQGIAVRTGHHCAQPILARFGLTSTVRPSFAFYNTKVEAALLVETLRAIGRQRPAP
jgi:cysteine desulfurase/selenocysteine lyase